MQVKVAALSLSLLLIQGLPLCAKESSSSNTGRVATPKASPGSSNKSKSTSSSAQTVSSPVTPIQGRDVNRPIRDKWAVVIGLSNFADPQIKLTYPAKDAADFYDFLISKMHFAKSHVRLLVDKNATKMDILDVLCDSWLPQRVLDDDLLVIFISTHGSPADKADENFIVPYDFRRDKPYATGIQLQQLVGEVSRRTGCDRVVLFLDACHSGAAMLPEEKGLVRMTNFDLGNIVGEGELIISSSTADQSSWESKRYANSVFTRRLIEALQAGGEKTTLCQAFNYLKENVETEVKFDRRVKQTPVLKSAWHGDDLILAVAPSRPRDYGDTADATQSGSSASAQPTSAQSSPAQSSPAQSTSAQSSPQSSDVTITPLTTRDNNATTTQSAPVPIAASTSSVPAASAPVLPAGSAPAAQLPDRIAIFNFRAPQLYDISKTNDFPIAVSTESLRAQTVPDELYSGLLENAAANFPNRLQPSSSIYAPQSWGAIRKIKETGAPMWQQIGQIVGAKYLVSGTIDTFKFRGKIIGSNDYIMEVTLNVISGQTGQPLLIKKLKYKRCPWLGDSIGIDVFLHNVWLPEVAKDIAKTLKTAIPAN